MDLDLLSTELRKIDLNAEFKIYLFGSSLRSTEPNDIDLLVVYKDKSIVNRAINYRRNIAKLIQKLVGLPADILLFNMREFETNHFRLIEDFICLDFDGKKS
jgi:predicted nucleotidyltransferase